MDAKQFDLKIKPVIQHLINLCQRHDLALMLAVEQEHGVVNSALLPRADKNIPQPFVEAAALVNPRIRAKRDALLKTNGGVNGNDHMVGEPGGGAVAGVVAAVRGDAVPNS